MTTSPGPVLPPTPTLLTAERDFHPSVPLAARIAYLQQVTRWSALPSYRRNGDERTKQLVARYTPGPVLGQYAEDLEELAADPRCWAALAANPTWTDAEVARIVRMWLQVAPEHGVSTVDSLCDALVHLETTLGGMPASVQAIVTEAVLSNNRQARDMGTVFVAYLQTVPWSSDVWCMVLEHWNFSSLQPLLRGHAGLDPATMGDAIARTGAHRAAVLLAITYPDLVWDAAWRAAFLVGTPSAQVVLLCLPACTRDELRSACDTLVFETDDAHLLALLRSPLFQAHAAEEPGLMAPFLGHSSETVRHAAMRALGVAAPAEGSVTVGDTTSRTAPSPSLAPRR